MRAGPAFTFRVGRVPVTVRAGFPVLVALAALAHFGRPATAAALVVMLPLSVLLHELGHAAVAARYGAQPQVTLAFVGGHTVSDAAATPRLSQQLAMVLAGPLSNLASGLVAVAFGMPLLPAGAFAGRLWSVPVAIWWTTIGMGLANLLPVLPLDGGRALKVAADRVAPSAGTLLAVVASVAACGLLAGWGMTAGVPVALVLALGGLLANLWIGVGAARRAGRVPAPARRVVAFAMVLATLAVLAPFGWRAADQAWQRQIACREVAAALFDPPTYRGDIDARMADMRRGRNMLSPAAEARQDAALVMWFTREAPDGRVHPAMQTPAYTRSHVPEPQRRRAVAGAQYRLHDYREHYC